MRPLILIRPTIQSYYLEEEATIKKDLTKFINLIGGRNNGLKFNQITIKKTSHGKGHIIVLKCWENI
jgi:hypothetical protein